MGNIKEYSKKSGHSKEKLLKIPLETKKCGYCKKYVKIELFGKCSSRGDGLSGYCKPCKKKYDAKYQKNNKKKILKQRKKYREKNKEKLSAADKKYRNRNKEKISKKKKQYYLNNREYFIDKNAKYSKKRYKSNINYKIASRLRGRLYKAINDNFKSGSAVKDLGCSIEELRQHLETLFYPHPDTKKEMTWDNWKIDGWHIDHIIPLSFFDLTSREQLQKACHYTNLQPLWAEENLSKGAKNIHVEEKKSCLTFQELGHSSNPIHLPA